MLSRIRSYLGWKIFLSYLVIILVGGIVLAASAEFAIPSAFDRHMVSMMPMMSDSSMGMGMMDASVDLESDLFDNFRNAVNEALARGTLAAMIAAVIVSLLISRQVVTPVREMMHASQHIAAGHYDERVDVSGDLDHPDELAQLALSFNRMADKLTQTENLRRQLIGDISHELRTPLTTIQGSMEGLMDGVLPAVPKTYQDIYKEAQRLEYLVDDLQELSRVEAGSYPLERVPMEIAHLIESVARRLRPQFDEKGVALELDLPGDLPKVQADPDRISQVLINLIGNALQYTPVGGVVSVGCTVSRKQFPVISTQVPSKRNTDRWLLITLEDSGIGIPAEHLPHIFDRFYRVDKSRSRAGGGSGIGLTIAKHLVEAHGGQIWAESEGKGKGSTFIFALPVF